MRNWLQRVWYGQARGAGLLWPLSLLFMSAASLRKAWLKSRAVRLDVPVVVVGNLGVGGTGKTPLIIALVDALRNAGFRPGVISRGYRAHPPGFPHRVKADDSAEQAGDEPLMIARQANCPVVIDPDRVRAGRHLLDNNDCDLVLSDDGLQHYRLWRDVELVVVDGDRGLGNGFCMPAGPLREPPGRLETVDFVVVNGVLSRQLPAAIKPYAMELKAERLQALLGERSYAIDQWPHGEKIHGVAGIGNPQRFWQTLEALGFEVIRHSFPDHHKFRRADLNFSDSLPVVMTVKDAVKCAAIADERCWQLPVFALLDDRLVAELCRRLR